jgi:hypothetical protein
MVTKKNDAGPAHKTPGDMLAGLSMARRYNLLTPDASETEAGIVTGLMTTYVMHKRTGRTDLGWEEWCNTADLEEIQEDEKVPDPTDEPLSDAN